MEEEDCATLDKNIMDKTSATLKRSKFTSFSLRKKSRKILDNEMYVKRRGFFPAIVKGERPWRREVIGEECLRWLDWIF